MMFPELWTVLLCSTRYSLDGRTEYVDEICSAIARFKALLTHEQLEQLRDEIKRKIDANRFLERDFPGQARDCDRWQMLVDSLVEQTEAKSLLKAGAERLADWHLEIK